MDDKQLEKDIRWLREKLNFSRREIAQALGISRYLVQKVLGRKKGKTA